MRSAYTLALVGALMGCAAAAAPAQPPTPPNPPEGVPPIDTRSIAKGCAGCRDKDFSVSDHVEMVNGQFENAYLQNMRRAMYWQDTVHQFESKAHFDNCAIDQSIAYVAEILSEVDGYVAVMRANPKAAEEPALNAFFSLGQALHGIQDFYAHSNYVEMSRERGVPFESLRLPGIWTSEGEAAVKALVKEGLVTGRVWWGSPKFCADSVPNHGALNKDSAGSPSGRIVVPAWNGATQYAAAKSLAKDASVRFLNYAMERWPELKNLGGKWIAFDVFQDRRDIE